MKTCKDCIYAPMCRNCNEYVYNKGRCEQFKDKSKFIEIPCSIGDTIWCIPKCAVSPIDFEVMGGPALPIYHSLVDTFVSISDFGKIAFLTKEEAEKKLEEMKNEKE